ncbi:DsbA family protein [Aggregatilinea lenta]|uniref:DsbA family protein n=1 Tax=Aggregatilinea lenta TaxID=913108 RepID=UPI000E5AD898|nr:thioredoxin domain-containing protein [Aggregatilinea lenta]
MATKTQSSSDAPLPNSGMPWPARAAYEVGRTRRARQDQFRSQMRVFWSVGTVALLGGLLLIFFSWREAGAAKDVSCADFPDFCVPLAGGDASAPFEDYETAASRTLDQESTAPETVTRGVTDEGMPYIGNADAPIHILEVADYACSHCQDYHDGDLPEIMDDLVLSGKASFQLVLTTGTGGAFSETASEFALCAGEQGAFWEVNEELYRLAQSQGVSSAFNISNLLKSGADMGLDQGALRECVSSGKYSTAMSSYVQFANDNGVTGTPTVMVNFGDGWRIVQRDYATLADLVDRANTNAG